MNDPRRALSCDDEPIHLIGAIQPHGALLAADAETRVISHVSRNAASVLGQAAGSLIGRRLDAVLGAADLAAVEDAPDRQQGQRLLRAVPVRLPSGAAAECLPHRSGDRLVLEFLPSDTSPGDAWEEDELRRQIISDLVRPDTLADLAELSARIVRRIIGFDRVMIYRFAEDDHGEVIAESTERQDSFLGLHYPASDIPQPARRHFLMNVVRTIGDINAEWEPLLTRSEAPLDLSRAVLRAVPPTHVQYLNNMGVAASMSLSLVSNDRLWGLIACHHYTARRVPPRTLRFAELLAGTISALLQGIENRAQLSRAIEAERTAFAMERQGRNGTALADLVSGWAPELMRLLDAQGLVFCQAGQVVRHGQVQQAALDLAPLRRHLTEGVAATEALGETLDLSADQRTAAAGAGYMELSRDGADYLALLREDHVQIVRWAGKPETVAQRQADGSTRLNPRASFALWSEERRGRSKPFDSTDLEALRIVRRALFALNSLERERAAVAAQKEAEAEEERLRLALLDASRRTSMGELASALAHELNQPLAAVSNYVNACRQQLRNFDARVPEGFDDLMLDAVTEAARAADLVRRLRDFMSGGRLRIEMTDLHAAIRQGAQLALLSHGSGRPELVEAFAPDLPPVPIDPIQIGQVVLNLANNAIAAMRDADRRVLTIQTQSADGLVRVSVRDTGPGIPGEMRALLFEPFHSSTTEGMGIGLSLCRTIVEAHGGRIRAPLVNSGGLVEFDLPLDRGEDER